ncbi:MAG: hypothetical protein H0T92_05785 [Pyrinomonadaceae bacterium]|jgi:hypothetical protein|nr:hypothetical protein [Pyrinomonadaceae bacterium]
MFTRALLLLLCLSVTSFGQTQVQPSNAETRSSTAPAPASTANPNTAQYEYRVLATSKTSTLQNELNDAAQAGFRFEGVMGGATSFGGSEGVVVMSRNTASNEMRYEYKLLATKKTSTMQKELQEAGGAGFDYRGQTIFNTTFGGQEVVVVLERPRGADTRRVEYKLFATSKTSTMQKELQEAGKEGFAYAGITVAETFFGGSELVVILRKPRS